MISQQELITRCKKGDPYAYTGLYNQHAKYVYNAICRFVEHTAEAEDILQETFVDAYQSISKLASAESFRPWIKRIAINKAISTLRKRRLTLIELDAEHTIADETLVNEDEFEFTINRVTDAIADLPLGYRTVFQLHAIEQFTHVEIGELLGITSGAVRVQYFRARAKVLETLKEGQYER